MNQHQSVTLCHLVKASRRSRPQNEAYAMLTRLRRSHPARSAPGSRVHLSPMSQAPLPWGKGRCLLMRLQRHGSSRWRRRRNGSPSPARRSMTSYAAAYWPRSRLAGAVGFRSLHAVIARLEAVA
jgi:hypothetical protein